MNSDGKALLTVTELPAVFVAVVIVVAVVSYCLGRRMRLPGINIRDNDDRRIDTDGDDQLRRNDDVVVVVEESPKMALWAHEKLRKELLVNWSCSVCLGDCAENDDNDALRLLPDCGHVFHRACVDSWLRLRPTCPLCRISPRGVVLKPPVVGDRGV